MPSRELILAAVISIFAGMSFSAPLPKEKESALKTPEAEFAVEPEKADAEMAEWNVALSRENLKNLGLAIHNFEGDHGTLPANIADKNGKPLLSWRVSILKFMEGQEELYKQFKLDEPWDSANNLKLLAKMPKLFASPRVFVKRNGYTVYQGFAGKETLFEPKAKIMIASVTDGTSNTIMLVESSVAVPWTKPADLPFDDKKDTPDFGKAYGAKPLAVMCDGSVRILDLKKIKPLTLKNAIMKNDGNVLGDDWEE
jgi:hypothetical protein